MKKLLLYFLTASIFVIFICGCGPAQQNAHNPVYDLQFPGLEWGMTPAELCAALELTEGEYVEATIGDGERYLIADVHMDAFGTEAQISFTFADVDSNEEYCLYQVALHYPAEADMQAVQIAVAERYGEPTEQSDTAVTWKSEALIEDYMSEEDKAMVEEHGEAAQRMAGQPISTITWTDVYSFHAAYNDSETTNVLTFYSDAAMYIREGGYAAMYAEE